MNTRLACIGLLLTFFGCDQEVVDLDGDGAPADLDCNDNDAEQAPGLRETCDGKDNNCSGDIDENAIDALVWYRDLDEDGFGDEPVVRRACEQPENYVSDSTDCNDAHATAYPGADELCDGIDNDCDKEIDEVGALDAPTWYVDGDDDGFGKEEVAACAPPDGTVTRPGDCNDERDDIYPKAPELCDGDDNDCDELIDEEPEDGKIWWPDLDGDGHGHDADPVRSCVDLPGYSNLNDDCDDTSEFIHPTHAEVCDGVDNDCNPGSSEKGQLSLDRTPYSSMADAVDKASGGETLNVCEGTWPSQITVSVDLSITGHGDRDLVVLDAESKGSAIITTSGTQLRVHGLTITNGEATNGGGIYAADATSIDISETVMTENVADEDGGAIYGPESGTTRIADSVLHNNLAAAAGGAVHASTLTSERAEFRENTATSGGGLAIDGGDVTLDTDTLIVENTATHGGGLAMLSAHQLTGGEFDNNSASDSGGSIWLTSSASALESVVHDSSAAKAGGGVYTAGDATLERMVLDSNSADQGGGLAANAGDVEVIASDLADNLAEKGGGVAVLGGTVLITSGTVYRNEATLGGGAWLVAGELESSSVDWGAGSNDNIDVDVTVGDEDYTSYAAAASFVCTVASGLCK